MTTGSDVREGALPAWWLVAVGAATTVVALACGIALQAWAQGLPPRHDLFEPFIEPWAGLSWITVLALWVASVIRQWPWLPLTAIGLFFVAIQVWMAIGAAWLGIQDGQVGGQGALAGALSTIQVGLTVVWMAFIVRSQRMPS